MCASARCSLWDMGPLFDVVHPRLSCHLGMPFNYDSGCILHGEKQGLVLTVASGKLIVTPTAVLASTQQWTQI
jgi:hypothetical protein